MSNIGDAKKAIQEELKHAREGLEYYRARVATLEATMSQLDGIDNPSGAPIGANPQQKRRGRKPGRKPRDQVVPTRNELPSLRGEYWVNFVTSEPQTAAEIFKTAKASLGFEPSKSQLDKLKKSQVYSLNHHVNISKRIQSSGAGRERRFYKP